MRRYVLAVSERDEARQRAQQTLRRLQHEVRTPISQIMGYADLLEEELAERGADDLARDLQKIRGAAQRLLDLADGKLREEADPGAPALPEAVPDAPETDPAPAGAAAPRVLVVDDDVDSRELLARRLAGQGFGVITARDGLDALRLIETNEPDLVLLEVVMAGMGGLEVLERVRRHRSRSELPIILATALDDPEDAVEGIERGANDYVTKPFDFPVLFARVRSQIETHHLARHLASLARQLEFRSTFIREALGREVSSGLLVELAERPDSLDLGQTRHAVLAVAAELRGSREWAESLAPAAHTAVLANVLNGLSEVVAHYEGVVESVTGDGLVALFGLPLPRADDAERAVACALAWQLELEAINERGRRNLLPPVEIGVGAASGEILLVALGTGAQVRYKAVGEPLALAARIEALARGGEVWICERTRRALGDLARVDREQDSAGLRAHRVIGLGGSQLIGLRELPPD